jgi:sulfite reductase (NADPH) flavoprotein alpha-component
MRLLEVDPGQGPLSPAQAAQFNGFVASLNHEQASWLLGYLTATRRLQETDGHASSGEGHSRLTVLYASQTGNAAVVAKQLVAAATSAGLPAVAVSTADYQTFRLQAEQNLVLIASTHGEGDPPESAAAFRRFLFGRRAPRLGGVRFAVLALGDESYAQFCKAGADFDHRLEELGAERILPRVDCDVDYRARATAWQEQVLVRFRDLVPPVGATGDAKATVAAPTSVPEFGPERPFGASVLERVNLSGRGSEKKTVHLELSLAGSGIGYQPGDSLVVLPQNAPGYVEEVLAALGASPADPVRIDGTERPFVDALRDTLEITTITPSFLQAYAGLAEHPDLVALTERGQGTRLRDYLSGREIIDVLTSYPPRGLSPQAFVGISRRLKPRHYSIASSPRLHPEEAHLLVRLVRYHSHGRAREGVASGYLCERVTEDATVRVFLSPNDGFRLPRDPDAPVIMVGPGTGVAPFRAFVEEREALGCRGRSWLFFGDQHFTTDFAYQIEWQRWYRSGRLSRVDLAFSRDQPEKVYVQHRMLEQAREIFRWLQDGAYFYLCGEGNRMAADVHQTLIQIVAQESNQEREAAEAYLDDLAAQRRYQRDVY